jgi:hypothetical protein
MFASRRRKRAGPERALGGFGLAILIGLGACESANVESQPAGTAGSSLGGSAAATTQYQFADLSSGPSSQAIALLGGQTGSEFATEGVPVEPCVETETQVLTPEERTAFGWSADEIVALLQIQASVLVQSDGQVVPVRWRVVAVQSVVDVTREAPNTSSRCPDATRVELELELDADEALQANWHLTLYAREPAELAAFSRQNATYGGELVAGLGTSATLMLSLETRGDGEIFGWVSARDAAIEPLIAIIAPARAPTPE